MTAQATVSMSWVHTVLEAACQQGVERAQLLAQAGIAAEDLALARWPIDHITRLWRAAVALTQDAGFGLKAGALARPANVNVVSFILQSSAHLREALTMLQKYQSLISDGGRFQLLEGGQASWLIYHPRQGELAFSPHQLEAVLAAVVNFARWVSGTTLTPQRVWFSHAALGPRAGYQAAFGCPVEFEQAYNGLLLANAALDAPLLQADAELARVHETLADARLQALAGAPDLATTLQAWIATHLGPTVPTRAQAARAFSLQERTLARRLQAQGQDFRTLVDEVRREAALKAVAHTLTPFAQIAQDLGFAEASPFYRAFARWSGTTPARWRERAQEIAKSPSAGQEAQKY